MLYLRFHIKVISYDICLSLFDLLTMLISSHIHDAADGIITFFLWLSNIPLYVHIHTQTHTTSSLPLICQWTFRLFPVLATVNRAAMNIAVHVSS